MTERGYNDRVAVPVLWDAHTDRIVSNESADIIEMLGSQDAMPGRTSVNNAVYHGRFKCDIRRNVDYPNLSAYLRDLTRPYGP
jgi:glutathionyl-hydroquinone reductase